MAAGIDDIAIYIPRLYVDAADFAQARGLDPAKLQKGLGVSQMAIVDTNLPMSSGESLFFCMIFRHAFAARHAGS